MILPYMEFPTPERFSSPVSPSPFFCSVCCRWGSERVFASYPRHPHSTFTVLPPIVAFFTTDLKTFTPFFVPSPSLRTAGLPSNVFLINMTKPGFFSLLTTNMPEWYYSSFFAFRGVDNLARKLSRLHEVSIRPR